MAYYEGQLVTLVGDTPSLRELGGLKGRSYSVIRYFETAMGDYVEISLPRGKTACIPSEVVRHVIHKETAG